MTNVPLRVGVAYDPYVDDDTFADGSTRKSVLAKNLGGVENVREVFDQRLPESTANRDELCMWTAYNGDPPGGTLDPDPF